MAPLHLPTMREELPPIQTKNGCRRKTTRFHRQNSRCESSRSSKSDSSVASRNSSGPIDRLAGLLKHRKCKDIIIMAGAGISTASGIPDFRSPGTGLYYNTGKYNVTTPTDVFDLKYFNRNPHPFLDIIRDFLKTEKHPNIIHSFCKMLEARGLLLRMYTQNIDGLEKKSGISSTRLVEAHGTLETASCCKCFSSHSANWTEKMILERRIPCCKKKGCTGYVKPDVVMFGEELPKKFYLYPKDFQKCDLLIIMGTSLNVEPFSELVEAVPKNVPRVLLNRDAVGPFSGRLRKNDIFIKGDINKSIKQTLKVLKWSTGVLQSENGSSSDITESDVECNTWATSRHNLIKETLVQKTPRDVEALSLPNSVIRKQSDQNLVNKMSMLGIEESAEKTKSRRSVSAPLPKSDQQKSIAPTVPAKNKKSTNKVTDTLISSVTSSEVDPASPPKTLSPSSDKVFSSVTISPNLSDSLSAESLPDDKNIKLKASTVCKEKTSLNTKQTKAVLHEAKVYTPRSRIHIPTVNISTESRSPSIEINDMINVQHEKNVENDEAFQMNVESDKTYQKMTVLSNHNDISIVDENPSKPTTPKPKKSVTIKGVTRLHEPRPLYKMNRQTKIIGNVSDALQINTTDRQTPPTAPVPPPRQLIRKKSSSHKIGSGLNTVPSYEKPPINNRRSYSNLFTTNTSDMFKHELKSFINSRGDSESPKPKTKSGRRSGTQTAPHKQSRIKSPELTSTISNYRRSSKLVHGKLVKKDSESDLCQWRLATPDKEIIARNSVQMFNVKKSAARKRNVKKQVLLQTTPLYDRKGNPTFRWK